MSADQLDLASLVSDFCSALKRVDDTRPVWHNARTGAAFLPGIGPHPETEAVRRIVEDLRRSAQHAAWTSAAVGVPYPSAPRQKCDLVLGEPPQWAVEVKLFRLLGDNGKLNDNMLMHVLSPYPAHRSALTDVKKLASSGFECRLAVLVYAFDYDDWPAEPALEAFALLARQDSVLSSREEAAFEGLVHPVQRRGKVCAWELKPRELTAPTRPRCRGRRSELGGAAPSQAGCPS